MAHSLWGGVQRLPRAASAKKLSSSPFAFSLFLRSFLLRLLVLCLCPLLTASRYFKASPVLRRWGLQCAPCSGFSLFFYVRPSSLANIAVCVKACTLPTSPGFCCCRHCKHCSSHDLSVRMFIDKRGSGRHPLSYSRKRAGAVCRRTCSLVLCKYDEGGSAAGLRQATMRIPKEHVVVGPGGGYL